MVNPLSVVMDGYLKCASPLTVVNRGYLSNCDGVIIPPVVTPPIVLPGSGSGYKGKKGRKILEIDKDQDLRNEDEEIMIIIKAFVECQ